MTWADRQSSSTAVAGLSRNTGNAPLISIVIPTLNEEGAIGRCLEGLTPFDDSEILVVDGGSSDGTERIVRRCAGAHPHVAFHTTASGRAVQMNAGALKARGEMLLFLHADTVVPASTFRTLVTFCRKDHSLYSGAFAFRVDGEGRWFRWLERSVGWRNRTMKLPFGDQGIFVRRSVFGRLGGYREDYPIMEDVDLVRRLKTQGGFRILHDHPVITSGRRWEEEGYLYTSARNLALQLAYVMGVHPRRFARLYRPNGCSEGN